MYNNKDKLVVFDADGTIIDAFTAIERTFASHGMDIGDLDRFQRRRRLFKYFGGLRELPGNLRRQFGKQSRAELLATLTRIYREEATLYPGVAELIRELLDAPGIRLALVTRNVSNEPDETMRRLFARHDIDLDAFAYFACLPLGEVKTKHFRLARAGLGINPARAFACGDEHKDYAAAVGAGLHPLMVSYGFEGRERLVGKFGIPEEIIAATPEELCLRLRHALV